MTYPWANTLLLLFIGAELVSGYFGLTSGSEERAFHLQVHRVAGYGILAVLGWKTVNVLRSLKWPVRAGIRTASLVLTLLLVLTLALGFVWAWAGPFKWGPFSGVSWHIYVGVALVPLLGWHAWHMVRHVQIGFLTERRLLLRAAGLAGAGFVGWRLSEGLVRAAELSGESRRFTGSYEADSFSGNRFPRVSWLNDSPARVNVEDWNLDVSGVAERRLTLGYDDLIRDAEMEATIDCTGGWHSTQQWSGVWLSEILDAVEPGESARSVVVRSVTGYYRRFSLDAARGFLLATHVGGETLSDGHGYPVRLVAPGRRGFEWVKWVSEIELSEAPAWWQPPLPVQ